MRFFIHIDSPLTAAIGAGIAAGLLLLFGGQGMAIVALVTIALIVFVQLPNPVGLLGFLGSVSYSLYLTHVQISPRIMGLVMRLGPFPIGVEIGAGRNGDRRLHHVRLVVLPGHRGTGNQDLALIVPAA
jgi:hypothetical protein